MLTSNKVEKLLKVVSIEDETTPVNYVCYHPISEKYLRRGQTMPDGRDPKPDCLAVEYEYDSVLREICVALGWQGGTRSDAIAEIKRLVRNEKALGGGE